MLQNKFAKKPVIAQANIKALTDGYNYGNNIHASVSTYRIESKKAEPGFYTDVNGNKATSYGLIAAAEKAGLQLFLGSYPITPATDILLELSKRKDLGVITVQAEDEIADDPAADCRRHAEDAHTENIHLFFQARHRAGQREGDRADDLKDQNQSFHACHRFLCISCGSAESGR